MNAKNNEKKGNIIFPNGVPKLRLALFLLALAFAIFVFAVQEKPSIYEEYAKVTLVNSDGEKKELNVEVVATMLSRNKGLMHRESLDEDSGMLFVFDEERPRSMWMKNTLISLDMFFIKNDGTIANISENTVPKTTISHSSQESVLYVLETNAGVAGKYNIKAGDKVIIDVKLRESEK